MSDKNGLFVYYWNAFCQASGIDESQFSITPEYKFHPKRRWRFDFAFVEQKVAVEIEGGAWIGGRHTTGMGYIGDLEKYNTATAMGWSIIRYEPNELTKNPMQKLALLLALLQSK